MDYNQLYKLCNILSIKYLSRYSVSSNKLKEYLIRKITKITKSKNEDEEIDNNILTLAIDNLIIKLSEMGYLNDKLYAQTKKNNLTLSGKSSQYIKLKLQEKGIEKEIINEIFNNSSNENDNLSAIIKTIKIKRFFAFRRKIIPEENIPKQNEKEIASLFRQGFSYDIIKQVKDKTCEEITELLADIQNN